MSPYSWLTNSAAIAAFQGRLFNSALWTPAELQMYLADALRTWNALTETWRQDFVFTNGVGWSNLGTLTGSPRLRTVTDAEVYSEMQCMLFEPPSGAGPWLGTNQFNLAKMQYALQRRRDEMIQATNCNLTNFSVATTSGTRRNPLADTVLEPQRIRFIPAAGQGVPNTLTREDTQVFQSFESSYLQMDGTPESWSVASEPPLAFDVDTAPNVPGAYDVIALQSGPTFAPPASTLLGVPDDWSTVLKWGALADLLSAEPEATDTQRAAYCLRRFTDGLKIMQQSNWLLQANLNGVPCDTPSVFGMDSFAPEWQDSETWPTLVNAGMDFVYAVPTPQSVNVTLVGNQPVPQLAGDFVQISRDVFDVVLSYAQRLAAFKLGGQDFAETEYMEKDFYRAAAETNARLLKLGLFTDILYSQGKRDQIDVPR